MAYPEYEPIEVDKLKLTVWYPISQNPTVPGYYHWGYGPSAHQDSNYFWYWDGEKWYYDDTKEDTPYLSQETYWRGLKEKS